jgi:phosphoribosyl 1,2-cyclic phosphodiesterase
MVVSAPIRRFLESTRTVTTPSKTTTALLANATASVLAFCTAAVVAVVAHHHHDSITDPPVLHKSTMEAAVVDNNNNYRNDQENRPRLIFLGTGSSTGCPKPICVMKMHHHRHQLLLLLQQQQQQQNQETASSSSNNVVVDFVPPSDSSCTVSFQAIQGPQDDDDPKKNKNYRNNPSLLIQHYHAETQSYKNIVIDVGKTFRETALRWFPKYGISSLDAIVLTHHHMDAAGGMDDVRGFQSIQWVNNNHQDVDPSVPNRRPVRVPLPLYLSNFCRLNLQSQFPWLLPHPDIVMPKQFKDQPNVVQRDVASFHVTEFQDYIKETIQFEGKDQRQDNHQNNGDGFDIIPLPVWHGDDLISHAFAFTVQSHNEHYYRPLHVLYISDISKMVPATLEYIQTNLPATDILIVDALLPHQTHPVHFSLDQAVDLAKQIQPKVQTYLIGMSCDAFLPHDEMNAYLHDQYHGTVTMAHDGLVVDLPTKSEP